MGIVESEIAADNTPSTPEEWFDANVKATFHAIVENMVLRSESEKVVLHALIDDLDKDPEEVISKLEVAPINQGGGGYVDPVTAQILADNAALRNDVRELLDALKASGGDNANQSLVTQAETDVETSVTTPPAQVTPPAVPTPIQSPPPVIAPDPTAVETPVTVETPASVETPVSTPVETPAPAPLPPVDNAGGNQ